MRQAGVRERQHLAVDVTEPHGQRAALRQRLYHRHTPRTERDRRLHGHEPDRAQSHHRGPLAGAEPAPAQRPHCHGERLSQRRLVIGH